MDTEAFLRTVWPDKGWYCIAMPCVGYDGFDHYTFETIPEAAAFALRKKDERHVYFGTHVLKAEQIWNPLKKGGPGWSVRTQKNSRAAREFFCELDVGEGDDKYRTQNDAVAALKKFLHETGLPVPFIVNSGYGVHVHWPLEEEVLSQPDWFEAAARLKQLFGEKGLRVDPMRTTDSASVLRVPGTINHKRDAQLDVILKHEGVVTPVAEFLALLPQSSAGAPLLARGVATSIPGLGTNTDVPYTGPPTEMADLIKVCPQIAKIAMVNGRDSNEPEWYAALGVVKYTVDGRKHCHDISSGHADYNAAKVDAKIDQWRFPPTTCGEFHSKARDPKLCEACPFFSKRKKDGSFTSPIVFAHPLPEPDQINVASSGETQPIILEVPPPPFPYTRREQGGYTRLVGTGEAAEVRVVWPYDLFPVERASSKTQGTEHQVWRANTAKDGWKIFAIPASTFVDPKALRIHLANHGLYCNNSKEFAELMTFMSSYIKHLQEQASATLQHDSLGWINEHTEFVLPNRLISPGGDKPCAMGLAAASAQDIVCSKGNITEQIESLKLYDDDSYIPAQFFIMSSLASTLLWMTGQKGVIINAKGMTGRSKSTALECAGAFWGPPKDFVIDMTHGSITKIGRFSRRVMIGNLPPCLDEITEMTPDEMKQLALGVDKARGESIRAGQTGALKRRTLVDCTSITMCTGNLSMHSQLENKNVAGTAGSMRVFEIEFNITKHKKYQSEPFIRKWNANYGHIGPVFVRYVVDNLAAVEAEVIQVMEALEIEIDAQPEERFWTALIACNIVALRIARDLGFVTWSMVKHRQFALKEQFPISRGVVEEEKISGDPLSVLGNFFERYNGNVLVTQGIAGFESMPLRAPGYGQLLAHFSRGDKKAWVLKEAFKLYCRDHAYKWSEDIIDELVKTGACTNPRRRTTLGVGTNYAKGRTYCFELNMAHPDLIAIAESLVDKPKPQEEAADT